MRGSRYYQVALGILLLTSAGCVRQGAHSLRRGWFDFNTLNEPAIFWEQSDHLPYHRDRVAQFRWGYGKDPGHQYGGLKFDPPPPPGIEDEVQLPPERVGLPLTPGTLWRDGVPAPVYPTEMTGSLPETPGPGLQWLGSGRLPGANPPANLPPQDGHLPPLPQPPVPVLPPALQQPGPGPTLRPPNAPNTPPGWHQGTPMDEGVSDETRDVRLTSGARDSGESDRGQPAATSSSETSRQRAKPSLADD